MNVLKLNSYFYEVGERSFMKEALAYQVSASSHCSCASVGLHPLFSVWQTSSGCMLSVPSNNICMCLHR
jgi:hypothetical protein